MTKLEQAVSSSGNAAFSMSFRPGFPAEFLSAPNPFSTAKNILMGDIIHPDDYQPFCEVMNEIVNGSENDLRVHARIKADGQYKWFYISAKASRNPDGSLAEMDGMMFDVSAYLDCDGEDPVMRRYRSKSSQSMNSAQHTPPLKDILGEDYLIKVQQPFSHIKGLFSAIIAPDGKTIAVAAGQDKRANLNKMNYQRKKNIRIKHQPVAAWLIAGESQEEVDANAQLLETMVKTVSGIANSYVVLCEEMENSQNANKLLGQNFEDQILINNLYSLILRSPDTKTSISSIIPLIRGYFSLDDIVFGSGTDSTARIYRWDESGMILPVVTSFPQNDAIHKELDYNSVVFADEKDITNDKSGDRSFALSLIYENGQKSGVIVYIARSGKQWTDRDRKLLKTITQILSTVINRYFMEAELEQSQEHLSRLAYYDFTTNIPNRSMFEKNFSALVAQGQRGAVISVEIANLKSISEIYSCEYADDIVRSIAEYISAIPCSSDKNVYRFSNDILFLTLTGGTAEEARQLAQAILTKFRSPWYLRDTEHHLEVYAGVTIYPDDAEDIADCLKAATRTLRLAKERRLGDAVFYSDGLEEQLSDNLRVKKLIIDAAENEFKGFYLLYTPVLTVDTVELHCCEANLFWGNDDIIVSRKQFLPIIDRLGLSVQMYRYVVDRICEFCATIRKNGFDNFRVSFAIPENIINSDACVEALRGSLLKYSLPPSAVSISVSESAGTLNTGNMFLNQLSKIGVNIIADDYGESFFTTAPLQNPAVKTVKIRADRFKGDPISDMFMRSVIKLAHEKDISVCVRGIDNAETMNKIRKFDVDLVEGIINGRPLHSTEFMSRLVTGGTVIEK